jgi:hypothetical protein
VGVMPHERCSECGSWGEECSSEKPDPTCGCARCARASRADLLAALEGLVGPGAHTDECTGGYECRCPEDLARHERARAAIARAKKTP